MGLGLTTQLQRQVGTQIAKLIIFTPSRVNLNKRNSIHPTASTGSSSTKNAAKTKAEVLEKFFSERMHKQLEEMSGLKIEDYEVGGIGYHT